MGKAGCPKLLEGRHLVQVGQVAACLSGRWLPVGGRRYSLLAMPQEAHACPPRSACFWAEPLHVFRPALLFTEGVLHCRMSACQEVASLRPMASSSLSFLPAQLFSPSFSHRGIVV